MNKCLVILVVALISFGCQNVKNVATTVDGINKNNEAPEYDTEKSRRISEMPDISVFFSEEEVPEDRYSSSLWNVDGKSLFGDGRASRMGDIVFILIEEESSADLEFAHSKSGYTDYEPEEKLLPEGETLESYMNSEQAKLDTPRSKRPGVEEAEAAKTDKRPRPDSNDYNANGSSQRVTSFTGKIAVRVEGTDKYGNLYLKGTKTTLLNNEIVTLEISGYARKEDISTDNTIISSNIENLEFTYNGAMYVGEPRVSIGENQKKLNENTEVTEAELQPVNNQETQKSKSVWPFGSF